MSSIYKRGDAWWGRLSAGGREHRRSLRTGNRAEAKERLKAWEKEVTEAVHFGIRRLTWQEAVLRYKREVLPTQVGAKTQARYLCSFRQVDPMLRGLYVDKIDDSTLVDLVTKRRAKGAGNATINRDMTAISQVLGMCKVWKACASNPAHEFDRHRVNRERRDPIVLPMREDVDAVLAECPGLLADLTAFAEATGARQEEIGSLSPRQIDMAATQMVLVGKGEKLRVVPLDDRALSILRRLPRKLGGRFVFWHDDGERYANISSRFAMMVRRAAANARKAGREFRPFRFHDLRHLFAVTYLKARRGSIYDLQQILGHVSIKTTEMYLAYLTPEEAEAARTGNKTGQAVRTISGTAS